MTDLHALIGRTLGGRYRVEALLGRGGFGAVYRAVHVELDRPVAIKTLVAGEAAAVHMQARFRREARVQAELRHPCIVHLLDFGREPDGTCYMVQEFVSGRTLQQTIDVEGPLEPRRAARIICDVLDGLSAAHRRGIVHRDIKPANIMLVQGPDGEEVRLLDFGIAKVRDAVDESQTLTVQGQILGTPAFMAPEQIQQETLSPATDLYAIGGVLYFLLTGRKPYSGGLKAILTAHLMQPAPTLPSDVPRAFDRIIERAMAKERHDRYHDAGAMHAALAEVVQAVVDEPVRAHPRSRGASPVDDGRLPDPSQDTLVTPAGSFVAEGPESNALDPSLARPETAARSAPRRWLIILVPCALLVVGLFAARVPDDDASTDAAALAAPAPFDASISMTPFDASTASDRVLADLSLDLIEFIDASPADGTPDGSVEAAPPPNSPATTSASTGRAPVRAVDASGATRPKPEKRPPRSSQHDKRLQRLEASRPPPAPPLSPPESPEVDQATPPADCDPRVWRLQVDGHLANCRCSDAAALLERLRACGDGALAHLETRHRSRCLSTLPSSCRREPREE